MRAQSAEKPDLAAITEALTDYEASVKATEGLCRSQQGSKIGSSFVNDAKSFLATAKQLMRRIRDKVPYSQGDRMMLQPAAAAGWSRARRRA